MSIFEKGVAERTWVNNSIPIMVDGIEFSSQKAVAEYLSVSTYVISTAIKKGFKVKGYDVIRKSNITNSKDTE